MEVFAKHFGTSFGVLYAFRCAVGHPEGGISIQRVIMPVRVFLYSLVRRVDVELVLAFYTLLDVSSDWW